MKLSLIAQTALVAIFARVGVCQTGYESVGEIISPTDPSDGAPTAAPVDNWFLNFQLPNENPIEMPSESLESGPVNGLRAQGAQQGAVVNVQDESTSYPLGEGRAATDLSGINEVNVTEATIETAADFLNETQDTMTGGFQNDTESIVLNETISVYIETTTSVPVITANRNVTILEAPDNFVVVGESLFATLDNAWQNAPIGGDFCASSYGSFVPEGWKVAEDTHEARIAIELNTFGTTHIVLANVTYSHQLTIIEGKVETLSDGSVKATAVCPNRILIQRIDPAEKPVDPYTDIEITNFVTFKGKDYAMINNVAPTVAMEGGCDHGFYKVPDGWNVAEDNNDTLAVIMTPKYPFMYICKITSSGKAYDFTLGSIKEFDYCQGSNQLVSVHSVELDAHIVSVNANNCGAIIVSRPDTNRKPSWVSGPLELTNTYIANMQGHTYATLDNTAPGTKYADVWQANCATCCQNVAMAIPDGWVVATPDMPGYDNAAAQQWGTDCIGGTDHLGKACNYTFTATLDYASVRLCDQKVLVKRQPQNCVSDWTAWSACPAQCPATQSRTRTDMKIDAMYGGTCDRTQTRNCTESQCNASVADRSENTSAAYAMHPSLVTGLFSGLLLMLL